MEGFPAPIANSLEITTSKRDRILHDLCVILLVSQKESFELWDLRTPQISLGLCKKIE